MTQSMTALVSAFARAYHTAHNSVTVFRDPLARAILTDQEYAAIAQHMTAGAAFFSPEGSPSEDPLRRVMNLHLAPTPLGRATFAETALQRAVELGAGQYLILGAGYDTFAYRQPPWAGPLQIFELDRPDAIRDKERRLQYRGIPLPDNLHFLPTDLADAGWTSVLDQCPAFDPEKQSVCSLLGLLYYLPTTAFHQLLEALRTRIPAGSSLVFDYPSSLAGKQAQLAHGAGETMQAAYSYQEMEQILSDHGFLIYEHLEPQEITRQFFSAYNQANPQHPMAAAQDVSYCLAVKHRTV